jgi:hypothetical protein
VTTTTKQRQLIAHGNYASIANCQEKNIPPYFVVYLEFFAVFQVFIYLFIYSTIFRGTSVGNPRGKYYKEQ